MTTRRAGSYSSHSTGPVAVGREAIYLYRMHSRDVASRVRDAVDGLAEIDRLLHQRYGFSVVGCDVLDVGCGQRLTQMAYFARRNRVVGIDLDVVAQGFDIAGYLRLFRANGARRAAKTLVRKALRLDAAWSHELARTLGLTRLPRFEVHEMDATRMAFASESFDFVYSLAVISHVPEPHRALKEIARVLRPGGVAYVSLPLYTSATGSLDPRILGGRTEIPLWAHLRPSVAGSVDEGAFMNRLRLADWRKLFADAMPSAEVETKRHRSDALEPEARALHARGELLEYTLEELVTSDCFVVWQKPFRVAAGPPT